MPQIIVASQNPVKIHATEIGFKRLFPIKEWSIRGESIASDVSAQLMSDEKTRQEAKYRALKARNYIRMEIFGWV